MAIFTKKKKMDRNPLNMFFTIPAKWLSSRNKKISNPLNPSKSEDPLKICPENVQCQSNPLPQIGI